MTNGPLSFYTVSEEKIDGGRFIDTAAIPKAGYIAAKPDLVVSTLSDVHPPETASISIKTGTNSSGTVVTNTRPGALVVVFLPEDAKRFAALTEQTVGKRLLIMLGDKPLTAPVVRGPIATGMVEIEFGRDFGEQAEVERAQEALRRLIRKP